MVPRQVASPGFPLANIGSLDTAGGTGEVALGVVAYHKDLVRLEPHCLQLLEVIGGIGLAAGGISHVRHELKGGRRPGRPSPYGTQ